jgi:hypothetical protein
MGPRQASTRLLLNLPPPGPMQNKKGKRWNETARSKTEDANMSIFWWCETYLGTWEHGV